MLTVGSLFAGIGGLDLGLERAGMQVRWQVENNPYCIRVLEKHWPEVKRYGNIFEVDGATLEPVDIICGGFPCQPVSHAGKRKGTADDRWLWPEFVRIIRQVRPRYVLVENVPGLLSINTGRLMGRVLGDLALCGYDSEWDCISAASVGALHRRDRVFIVAYTNGCSKRTHPRAVQEEDGILRGKAKGDLSTGCCEVLAYPNGYRLARPSIPVFTRETFKENSNTCRPSQGDVPNTDRQGQSDIQGRGTVQERGRNGATNDSGWWDVEPDVGRVADGVPSRVDRLRAIGNAVVPQVGEMIGRMIMERENAI